MSSRDKDSCRSLKENTSLWEFARGLGYEEVEPFARGLSCGKTEAGSL